MSSDREVRRQTRNEDSIFILLDKSLNIIHCSKSLIHALGLTIDPCGKNIKGFLNQESLIILNTNLAYATISFLSEQNAQKQYKCQIIRDEESTLVFSPPANLLDQQCLDKLTQTNKLANQVREFANERNIVQEAHSRLVGEITERRLLSELLTSAAIDEGRNIDPLLNILPCGVSVTFDNSCKEIRHNPAMAKFLRIKAWDSLSLSANENAFIVRQNGTDLKPEDLPIQRAAWKGEEVDNEEYELIWGDGVRKYGLFSAIPLRNKFGTVIGAVSTSLDITNYKQALESLSETGEALKVSLRNLSTSQARYRDLFNNMENPCSVRKVILDEQGNTVDQEIIEVNPSFAGLVGRKIEELINTRLTELFPSLSEEPFDWIRELGKVALSGKAKTYEAYSKALAKWFKISAYSPQAGLVALLATDVTEERLREQKLQQINNELEKSNRLLMISEALIRSLSAALGSTKQEFLAEVLKHIHELSGCDFVGIKIARPTGVKCYHIKDSLNCDSWLNTAKQSDQMIECICSKVLAGTLSHSSAYLNCSSVGSFWTNDLSQSEPAGCLQFGRKARSFAVIPVKFRGKAIAVIHLVDDRPNILNETTVEILEYVAPLVGEVLNRQEIEEAFRTSEEKYRNLVEDSNVIILSLNKTGEIIFINEYGEKLLGYEPDELLKRPFKDTILPRYDSRARDMWGAFNEMLSNPEQNNRNLFELIAKNGQRLWIEWTHRYYPNAHTKSMQIISVGVDVTSRERAAASARLNFERSRRRTLMNDLVKGRMHQEAFMNVASKEGFLVNPPFACGLVVLSLSDTRIKGVKANKEEWQVWLNSAIDIISSRLGGVVWQSDDGLAIMKHIGNAGNKVSWIQDLLALVRDVTRGAKFSVGVSDVGNEIKPLYKQAYEATIVGPLFQPDNGLFFWRELGVARIMLEQAKSDQGALIIEQYLGPLFNDPSAKKEEWMSTLKALLSGDQINSIAERLHVHPKTVGYRRRKIEQALGIRLDDPEASLNLVVAMKLMQLRSQSL